MKTNKIMTLIVMSMFTLLSINGIADESEAQFLKELKYKHVSIEQVEKLKGKIMTEAFEFVGYNDDSDYDKTFLKNAKNEIISMTGGVNKVHNLNKGDSVIVKWSITTLYEAGEGDAPYYFRDIKDIQKK